MQISKKSWHSRLYTSFYNTDLPESLCPYFWKLMLPIGIILAIITLVTVILVGMITVWYNPHSLVSAFGMAGYFAFLVVIVAIIIRYNKKGINYLNKNKPKKVYKHWEEKKPNIFVEYWKAFLGRYCPRIIWIEDSYTNQKVVTDNDIDED